MAPQPPHSLPPGLALAFGLGTGSPPGTRTPPRPAGLVTPPLDSLGLPQTSLRKTLLQRAPVRNCVKQRFFELESKSCREPKEGPIGMPASSGGPSGCLRVTGPPGKGLGQGLGQGPGQGPRQDPGQGLGQDLDKALARTLAKPLCLLALPLARLVTGSCDLP